MVSGAYCGLRYPCCIENGKETGEKATDDEPHAVRA